MGAASQMVLAALFAGGATASKWNAADKGANIVLGSSDYDCVSSSGGASFQSVRGTLGQSAGKLYFEIKKTTASTGYGFIGFADNAAGLLAAYPGNVSKSFGVRPGSTGSLSSGVGTVASSTGPSMANGDYFQFALDFTNSKMFLGVNNVWQNSGDPVAGTGAWITSLVAGTYFPAASEFGGFAETFKLVTAAPFNGTLPSGYSAWG